ncbi:conjugal transfer protein TrbF [Salmonella enterica]|nr:conjugal transfer protein TrbF [Salmonella enterica]
MTKEQAIQQKIKQITNNMNKRYEKTEAYIDYGLVTLVAGGLLNYSMHLIFDVCIDDWIKDPAAQFYRQMWNVLMYAIPWTLYVIGASFWATYVFAGAAIFSTGTIKIRLLKYRLSRESKKHNVSH